MEDLKVLACWCNVWMNRRKEVCRDIDRQRGTRMQRCMACGGYI